MNRRHCQYHTKTEGKMEDKYIMTYIHHVGAFAHMSLCPSTNFGTILFH